MKMCLADMIAAQLRASTVLGNGLVTQDELKELFRAAPAYGVPLVVTNQELNAMIMRWVDHGAQTRAFYKFQRQIDANNARFAAEAAANGDDMRVIEGGRLRRAPDRFKPGK